MLISSIPRKMLVSSVPLCRTSGCVLSLFYFLVSSLLSYITFRHIGFSYVRSVAFHLVPIRLILHSVPELVSYARSFALVQSVIHL